MLPNFGNYGQGRTEGCEQRNTFTDLVKWISYLKVYYVVCPYLCFSFVDINSLLSLFYMNLKKDATLGVILISLLIKAAAFYVLMNKRNILFCKMLFSNMFQRMQKFSIHWNTVQKHVCLSICLSFYNKQMKMMGMSFYLNLIVKNAVLTQ